MNISHGFSLIREGSLPECKSHVRFWRHDATGAELLSFTNDDENKVFGASFRTPPEDSTGLPHILEHSVLCGSEKYPVKEPFVELLKGSLQTFLNAFTYPDKTCYPVASANTRDFRNLTDVYLDAVFFPRISEDILRQEGWHLEPDGDGGFVFKGVVYNEMKGVFSSPEAVLSRHSMHALFPDTIYGLESGGDPAVIPNLTYADFIRFHKTCYHPSNARFFFWGDDDETERLVQVGGVINRFSRAEPAPRIALQERKKEPVTLVIPFAAAEDETKGMVCCNWLLADTRDVALTLGFRMLDHILLGMPASPLRRALIESGLGEDITGNGLEDELLQSSYSVGLRGVTPENAPVVETLILDTLRELVDAGIDAKYIDAAVNSVEFALREKNSGRFPVGLVVMLQSLTTWLHDEDPTAPLRYEEPLAAIKAKLAAGEPYFEDLVGRYLLDNTHRATVILTPDAALGAIQAQEEAARVAGVLAAMPEKERAELPARAEKLQAMQEAPDDPADLARIPRLAVSDLPRTEKTIPGETFTAGTVPVSFHDLPTSGISYADAFFDLSFVPRRLFPLLPLFGRALTEMGTKGRSFVDLNMAIASKTGGLDAGPYFLTARADRSPLPRLTVSGKAAPDRIDDLFSLMEEIILTPDFGQQERFLRMVLEEKARLEHSLVPSGHGFVSQRLRSALSATGMMEEMTGGVSYLFFLRNLADRVADDWASVRADLDTLHAAVFAGQGLAWNITGEAQYKETLAARAAKLATALPVAAAGVPGETIAPTHVTAREALLLPAQVNYVGWGGNLYDAGYAYHGSVHVILKQLRTGWLWEKVRVQGGAYGAFCSFDRMAGALVLASYRDPNVRGTLDIFGRTAEHLATASPSRRELDAAIIGAMGEVDAYMLPDAKGSAAFARVLSGDTPELRQKMREEILATTPNHFHAFAACLARALENGPVCVLGGDALEKTAKAENGWNAVKVL